MVNNSAVSSSSSMDSVSFDEFDFEFVEEVECLSHWEFLDACDADSGVFQIGDEGEEEEDDRVADRMPDDDLPARISPVVAMPVAISVAEDQIKDRVDVYLLRYQEENYDEDYGRDLYDRDDAEEDEGDDDEDDEGDLDDELVPWSVSGKFERQRMRKLGKRAFPRMYNSKKSPYLFTKPGCVRGKHGLGLKHRF